MPKYIVKVSHDRDQTRVTIPKMLAKEIGLDKAIIAIIRKIDSRTITMREWNGKKRGDRSDRKPGNGPNR